MNRLRGLVAGIVLAGAATLAPAAEPEKPVLRTYAVTEQRFADESLLDELTRKLDKHATKYRSNPRYAALFAPALPLETSRTTYELASRELSDELARKLDGLPKKAGALVARQLLKEAGALEAVENIIEKAYDRVTYERPFHGGSFSVRPSIGGSPGAKISVKYTFQGAATHALSGSATLSPEEPRVALQYRLVW